MEKRRDLTGNQHPLLAVKGKCYISYLNKGGKITIETSRTRDLILKVLEHHQAGLAHIEGMSQLQGLDLSGTQVTNNGLVHLAGLSRLRSLGLSRTGVTDAGLEHLRGLRRLEHVDVSGTSVTDMAMIRLRDAVSHRRPLLPAPDVRR